MVKERRKQLVLGGLLAVLAVALWWSLRAEPGAPDAGVAARPRLAARSTAEAPELPRVDLDRLQRPRAAADAGERNIFDFAPPPTQPAPPPPPPTAPPPTLSEAEVAAHREREIARAALPPPVPPLNVKYIGALESKSGLKVAVLLTDRKEILTGQAGETIANRLKIVAIGHESVDVQDVGSDRVRRIPLKGN